MHLKPFNLTVPTAYLQMDRQTEWLQYNTPLHLFAGGINIMTVWKVLSQEIHVKYENSISYDQG